GSGRLGWGGDVMASPLDQPQLSLGDEADLVRQALQVRPRVKVRAVRQWAGVSLRPGALRFPSAHDLAAPRRPCAVAGGEGGSGFLRAEEEHVIRIVEERALGQP